MCHKSHVTCHISHVRCHLSSGTCLVSHFLLLLLLELAGGGSGINSVYPFQFFLDIFGIGATISIGQEIQCLPYAEFLPKILPIKPSINYNLVPIDLMAFNHQFNDPNVINNCNHHSFISIDHRSQKKAKFYFKHMFT